MHGTTICVLWHDDYEFQPQDLAAEYSSFVDINIATLASSFEDNVVDAAAKRQQLKERDLVYDDLLLKLTLSIEMSHCEVIILSKWNCTYAQEFFIFDRVSWSLVNTFPALWPPSHRQPCIPYGARCTTNSYLPMLHRIWRRHAIETSFSRVNGSRLY